MRVIVTAAADVDQVFATAERAFGAVDCVVSDAGTIVTQIDPRHHGHQVNQAHGT